MNVYSDYLEKFKEIGYVEKISQSVAEVSGLPGVRAGEMVIFESGQTGQVSALKKNSTEILLLSKEPIKAGSKVTRMGRPMMIAVGPEILGHTISPLGRIILGGVVGTQKMELRSVDIIPPGIARRKKINQPMHTGAALVDLMIPLGKGQRELVMGDRKTGKSNLLLQAAISQVRDGAICIYTAIAKKKTDILMIDAFFKEAGALAKSVIVATSSQDSPGEIFLGPYTAMAIAEYFRDQGQDVLLILDDMSAHAMFYRELSLISRKFPGRDSYLGDIFHIHSKLLERAGNFDIGGKEVSITCLPVAETVQGDIAGYIQTNLMSMTDGHIYFDAELFSRGRRPAINVFTSVTRVGHQTQTPLSREVGRVLIDLISSYERTQGFLRFGAELGESSRQILTMGERVLSFFNQPINSALPFNLQLVLIALLISGIWNGQHMDKMLLAYSSNQDLVKQCNDIAGSGSSVTQLIETVRQSADKFLPYLE